MKILTVDMKGASLGQPHTPLNHQIQKMVKDVDVACFQNVKVDNLDSWKFEGYTNKVCGMSNKMHVNIMCTRLSNWTYEAENPSGECLFLVMHFDDPFSSEQLSICSLALNPKGDHGLHGLPGQVEATQQWISQNKKMTGGSHIIVGSFHTPRLSDYDQIDQDNLERFAGDAITLMDKAGYVDAYRLALLSGNHSIERVPLPRYLGPITTERYIQSLDHDKFRVPSAYIATTSDLMFRDTYVFASPAFSGKTVLRSYSRPIIDLGTCQVCAVVCDYEWK